jgi:hypothetical protein
VEEFFDDDIFEGEVLEEESDENEEEETLDLYAVLLSVGMENVSVKNGYAMVSCPHPEHNDTHPSAKVFPISNKGNLDYMVACYKCGYKEKISNLLKGIDLELPQITHTAPRGFVALNTFEGIEDVFVSALENEEAVAYAKSRGVGVETLEKVNALVIRSSLGDFSELEGTPYRKIFLPSRIDDKVVGLNYRNYHDDELLEEETKSGTVSGTVKSFLLGMEFLDPDKKTIVVEGLFDYLAFIQVGLLDKGYNLVCLCGASMNAEAFGVFDSQGIVNNLLFFTDNDLAGISSIMTPAKAKEVHESGLSLSDYFSGKKKFAPSVKGTYRDIPSNTYPSLIDYKKVYEFLEKTLDNSEKDDIINVYELKDPSAIINWIEENDTDGVILDSFVESLETFFIQ